MYNLYTKVINEDTKLCEVGTGTNEAFYQSQGMTKQDVEQAFDGNWYLAGYAPEKPVEQTAAEVRAERDNRIAAVRWRIERYQTQEAAGVETTETAEQYQALLMYIQALRNVPKQDGFPDNVVWPTLDAEIEAVNNMATVEASTD